MREIFLHRIRWHHVVPRIPVRWIIFSPVSLICMRVNRAGKLGLNIDQIIIIWLFLPWRLRLLGVLRLPLLSWGSTIAARGAPSVLILALLLLFVLVHGNRGV
jgi:hypothetical protein